MAFLFCAKQTTMIKTRLTKITSFRFRRFTRAKYAVFNSLHRVVTIGRLASYIADRQLRKSSVALASVFVAMPAMLFAQEDTVADELQLQPVVVVAPAATAQISAEPALVVSAEELQSHSVRSISDVLTLVAGIDLRTRGVNDVQGDISMRGGTFDQMLVLLNGVNLTDAQTGHYALDIPIDVSMVERVEILTPSMLLSRGIVAFCGAVNIVVSESYGDRLRAELSAGSHGTAKVSLLATKSTGRWSHTAAASYGRSDGYMENTDYRMGNVYLQSVRRGERGSWQFQIGGQMKDYGSQAFYSVSYPDQFESTRTLTASVQNITKLGACRIESTLYGRAHSDRFELFREGRVEAPAWYGGHNYHLSGIGGLRSRVVRRVGIGDAFAGAEVRNESIVSSVLGLPDSSGLCRQPSKYSHSASRLGTSLFAGYRVDFDRVSVEGDLLGYHNSAFGLDYGCAMDAVWNISRRWRLSAALSRTYRMPSFTDLYYQGANQVSNPDLNSEHSATADIRLRYTSHKLKAMGSLYGRSGRDIIDWVRGAGAEMWYSMNHTRVDVAGAELTASYRIGGILDEMGGSYAYCMVRQDAGEFVSSSALDYLRHKAQAYLVFKPLRTLGTNGVPLAVKLDVLFRERLGQYADAAGTLTPYGSVLLFNASLEYAFRYATLFVEAYNVTDRQYRDLGGVPQPGITILAGIRLNESIQ